LEIPVNLTCQSECIFDGANARRLFSFGETIWPQQVSIDFNIFFRKITFQNGRGVSTLPGRSDRQGGGGAFQMRGIEENSLARFEDCVFRNNNGTYVYNGGAIDVERGGQLDLDGCLFEGNTAHTGGAINAFDIPVRVHNTVFRGNTVCGGGEGAAIYHAASELESEEIVVECVGSNAFLDNIDGICIDPNLNPGYEEYPYDILGGCTKNCGEASDPFCRL